MKKHELLTLFIIVLAAFILRAYKINDNFYFSGELGKEMLYIREFIIKKAIPLVGMPTSHEWLNYGPVYYWIMIPIFLIFNGDPFILFWIALTVSLLGLVLNYIVVKKIASANLALSSTLIQSLSPILIWQTRLSKLHVFFWILIPVIMYLLFLLWDGKKKWLIFTGIIFGLLFSFHFSQIPILGVVVLLFFIKKKLYRFGDYIKFGIGMVIPNITYIWRDLSLAVWVPYRVLNIENKDPLGTLKLFQEYFGRNIFWDNKLWIIGTILFIGIFTHYLLKNKNRVKKEFLPFYLISSIGLMLTANMLHGAPPVHYFLPIFTTVPLLFAVYISKIKYWPALLGFMTVVNLFAFNKDPLFYLKFKENSPNPDIVSYETQNNITNLIVKSANDREFSIKRIGPYDYFPDNYSQNYKYLTILKGGRLTDDSSNLYTIIESSDGVYVQE